MSDEVFPIPMRPNGAQKKFWYDREGHHMIYRRDDGELEAIGFQCRHEVEVYGE